MPKLTSLDETRKPIALDLFCGLGGWSDGLSREGFDVVGIEIVPKVAALYKHPCIIADIRDLDAEKLGLFDLIIGSPPCRDFSRMNRFKHWKIPADPGGVGMELVNAFLNIVQIAKPRFWLMENVLGLEKYLGIPPRCKARLTKTMIRGFWGNFPPFLIPRTIGNTQIMDIGGPLRKWKRAKIPLATSISFARTLRAFYA